MNTESDEYITGYKAGFGDGWDAAKQTFEKHLRDAANQVKNPVVPSETYKFQEGCPVCGIGKNGDPLGYACQHPSCPSRATFNRKMDDWWKQVANCDTTITNTLSEP